MRQVLHELLWSEMVSLIEKDTCRHNQMFKGELSTSRQKEVAILNHMQSGLKAQCLIIRNLKEACVSCILMMAQIPWLSSCDQIQEGLSMTVPRG